MNNKKENIIRVLHVVHGMDCGGVENFIMNIYRNIDKSKFQFDFLVHTKKECYFDNEIKKLGGNIYRMPYYFVANSLRYKKAMNLFFNKHPEIKIVHGHLGSCSHIYLYIANIHNCFTIAHSHSSDFYSLNPKHILYKYFSWKTTRTANHFFACSNKAGYHRYGKKIVNNKDIYNVIPNAIDTIKYKFNPTTRKIINNELRLNSNQILIGHVGSFYKPKNHYFIIKVFREILNANSEAKLLLIGEGKRKNNVINLVNKMKMSKSVIFLNNTNEIYKYMQRMDCLMFPSKYEGLGIVSIEAQAASLPCVVSDKLPDESKLTDLIFYSSLQAGAKTWANNILSRCSIKRDPVYNNKVYKQYDINKLTPWISNFYKTKYELQNSLIKR